MWFYIIGLSDIVGTIWNQRDWPILTIKKDSWNLSPNIWKFRKCWACLMPKPKVPPKFGLQKKPFGKEILKKMLEKFITLLKIMMLVCSDMFWVFLMVAINIYKPWHFVKILKIWNLPPFFSFFWDVPFFFKGRHFASSWSSEKIEKMGCHVKHLGMIGIYIGIYIGISWVNG